MLLQIQLAVRGGLRNSTTFSRWPKVLLTHHIQLGIWYTWKAILFIGSRCPSSGSGDMWVGGSLFQFAFYCDVKHSPKATWGRKTKPLRNFIYWLVSHDLPTLLSYRTQDHLSGMTPPTVGWTLSHQSWIEKMLHRLAHRLVWLSYFLSWGLLFRMTLANRQNTTQHCWALYFFPWAVSGTVLPYEFQPHLSGSFLH